jgi:hypothetical protein
MLIIIIIIHIIVTKIIKNLDLNFFLNFLVLTIKKNLCYLMRIVGSVYHSEFSVMFICFDGIHI